jgi:timeless
MELRENSQYNLLMMEILHHILKAQDPMAVARSMTKKCTETSNGLVAPETSATRENGAGDNRASSSILRSKLKEEKAQRRNVSTVRHGHFGGTWMQRQSDGKKQFLSASAVVEKGGVETQSKHLVQARRKNRMAEPFIGSGKALLAHTRVPLADSGPATKRANQTLFKFCERFMADCYGPFMKSLKNEFRRDSARLEDSDKVVFFRLIWFFAQWWRSSYSSRSLSSEAPKEVIGRLIITMDVFSFNLVTSALETFYNHKRHTRLAQTVALYSEMMHLLHDMYTSKDKTEHEMAMGLIDRIFYGRQESLDPVPKLISRWTPGTFTREYLCDLVEVTHVSMKLLEANTKKGIEFIQGKADDQNNASQKIAKMRKVAADFDVKGYLVRKIVSNQMISMYGHLLTHYKVNSSVVNHRIIAMFLRLMRVEIASPDIADVDTPVNPLGTKRATLEPMLYNLQLIMVLEQILNDSTIRKARDFEFLLQFSTSLLYKFWLTASANPMLYAECLFRHVTPHRFCELVTNMYVSDELRMIAEKEMLMLEASSEVDEDERATNRSLSFGNRNEEEEEEELEFTGDAVLGGTVKTETNQTAPANSDETDKRERSEEQSDEDDEALNDEQGDSSVRNEKRPREDQHEHNRDVSPSKKTREKISAEEADSSDDDIDFEASRTKGTKVNSQSNPSVLDDTDSEL